MQKASDSHHTPCEGYASSKPVLLDTSLTDSLLIEFSVNTQIKKNTGNSNSAKIISRKVPFTMRPNFMRVPK